MSTGLIVAAVATVVVTALLSFVAAGFNKLRRADVSAQEALSGIDVQLTRRADLIPGLVEIVKGYAAHEKNVLENVAAARAGIHTATMSDDPQTKAAADLRLTRALGAINAVAEAYPELRANQNFLALQQQLADTENQLSFARQYYNDATATLNRSVMTLPGLLFAGMSKVQKREFYAAGEGQQHAPRISF